jgi:hypothetical protein
LPYNGLLKILWDFGVVCLIGPATGKKVDLLHELVDLRLIHLARSRITVSKRPGKIFEGYMLDVSQYAGSRKRHNFELVNFWKDNAVEELRRVKLIYDPNGNP